MAVQTKLTYLGQDFVINISNSKDPKDALEENIGINFKSDIERIVQMKQEPMEWLEKHNITSSTELIMRLIPEFQKIYKADCGERLQQVFAEAIYYSDMANRPLFWEVTHLSFDRDEKTGKFSMPQHKGFIRNCNYTWCQSTHRHKEMMAKREKEEQEAREKFDREQDYKSYYR